MAWLPRQVARHRPAGRGDIGWIVGPAVFALVFVLVFFGILTLFLGGLNAITEPLGNPVLGLTTEHYVAVWDENAPTPYGQPLAGIAALMSIYQPFTIWMRRSFFQNIPAELDEAARVGGCTHFQAFRWVITTGLFSFLPAYNDFLVTSHLQDAQNQTTVPAIAG